MELSAQEKQRMDKLSTNDQLKLKAIMQMMAKEKDAIEKDARKAKGMMEDQSSITKEIRFHINAYKDGTIDVDDMIQAIEEIIYGKISAPGQTMEEQEMPNIVNSLEALITNHLKKLHQGAYSDDIYRSFYKELMDNVDADRVELDGLDVEDEFDNFISVNRDSLD
jgi:hypothetical protein